MVNNVRQDADSWLLHLLDSSRNPGVAMQTHHADYVGTTPHIVKIASKSPELAPQSYAHAMKRATLSATPKHKSRAPHFELCQNCSCMPTKLLDFQNFARVQEPTVLL
jgi:hypothetical protein